MKGNNVEILLLGETGVGKSSLGNFIFNKEVFHVFRNEVLNQISKRIYRKWNNNY